MRVERGKVPSFSTRSSTSRRGPYQCRQACAQGPKHLNGNYQVPASAIAIEAGGSANRRGSECRVRRPDLEVGWWLWRKYDATMLATPQAFVRDPSLVWEFYHWRREVVSQCSPNPAHVALAAYERKAAEQGQRFVLITQNIDRLHQAAGSSNVVEMHGSLWDVVGATPAGCRDPARPPWEDRRQPLVPALAGSGSPDAQPADIPVEELPHSEQGQLLRPGVVWFNENLDDAVIDRIDGEMEAADLLLIIGTSSVVYPAAGYAPQVAKRGVPVVEINLEPTSNSRVCSMVIQNRAGELLPELLGVADNPAVAAAVAEQRNRRIAGGSGSQ